MQVRAVLILFFLFPFFIESKEPFRWGFDIRARQGNLQWDFTLNDPCPTERSNLKFSSLHIIECGLTGKGTVYCNDYWRACARIGFILEGTFKETLTDYHGTGGENLQTKSTLKTRSMVDGKHTTFLSIGRSICPFHVNTNLHIYPMIGYAYFDMNYRVTPHYIASFHRSKCLATNAHLYVEKKECADLKFLQRWWGPWIGIDCIYSPFPCLYISGEFEYHWENFKGVRFSSIGIQSIDQYNQSCHRGRGYEMKLEVTQETCYNERIGLQLFYQSRHVNWKNLVCSLKNKVPIKSIAKWHSWGIGLTYQDLF